MDKNVYKTKPSTCPACGSAVIAKILYGYRKMNPELIKDVNDKKVVLGCCVTKPDFPAWVCTGCELPLYCEGGWRLSGHEY